MTKADLVLVLALAAAFAFALSAFLQRRASEQLEGEHARDAAQHGLSGAVGLTLKLVRRTTWLLGWVVNLAGFLLQASALKMGSVAAVQPIMTAQLLFAMPLASWEAKRRPSLLDWLSGLAICGGVAILLVVDSATPLQGHANRGRVILSAAAALIAIVLLVSAAKSRHTMAVSAVLVASAAGLAYAMSAVFMKLTAESLVDKGIGVTARDWVGYALAASTLLGLVLGQAAFAGGPLPWAVAAMNVVNPAASFATGVLAFGSELPTAPSSLAALTGAGALLWLGVLGLARSSSRDAWQSGISVSQAGQGAHG